MFDLAIIGAGVAGAFAATRMAEQYKGNVILIDAGRPPGKRRHQIEGWMGCLPSGDGKLSLNDVNHFDFIDGRRLRGANNYVMKWVESTGSSKVIKNKLPSITTQKNIANKGFSLSVSDYIQWTPEAIHKLSKNMATIVEENLTLCFDKKVTSIIKDTHYKIELDNKEIIEAQNVLLCIGRRGWRQSVQLLKSLGVEFDDSNCKIGIKAELPIQSLKDFNKSHCSLLRDDLEIGPFCWGGSIIPEDHIDLVITSYRSNEDRWKTDKVSFSILKKIKFDTDATKKADRLAQLAFILANDRVTRERIKPIMNNDYSLNVLEEFSFLKETIKEVSLLIPDLISKGYYHIPTVYAVPPKVPVDKNLMTNIEGLYVAGESLGITGIMAAAMSGTLAVDGVFK